ncbi:divergent polysaccharide deacetylase family protein [Yoonia sp. BS5-3]|uniref:Divergent polysaccharide deacetylase family protein n=1 Tax=Yoonia phaeophyticola TaxID=3137369 RepID=A0ABZ2V3B8_9RHOB
MSGSVSGGLWGLVLGSVGLGIVSLVNEQPSDVVGNDQQIAVVADPVAPVEKPQSDTLSDVAPVALVEAPIALAAPEIGSFPTGPNVDLAASKKAPALQRVIANLGEVSSPDLVAEIITAPAEAPAESPQVAAEAAPAEPVITDTPPQIADAPDLPEVTAEPLPSVALDLTPEPETPLVEVPAPLLDAPSADDAEVVADAARPAPAPAPAVPDAETPAPAIVADAVPEVQPEEATPEISAEPQPPEPEIAATSPTPTIRVNRPGATPSETAGQGAEIVTEDSLADDASALERFAAVFELETELPLLSVVMIDDGGVEATPSKIAALPVPVTVVVDALAPEASEKMEAYRAEGVEVMLQTSLPSGAIPTDVEVAFEAAFAILPETVGLFSDASGLMQSNRAVAQQVVDILGSEGRGLVVVERGLGGALRIAEQAGLPAAAVLRDLDGNGEGEAAVMRALDQAAFRARQTGNAVLLARSSTETLAALENWGAENNGAQIALAPASAVLLKVADSE